jgi:hypothetical protein
MTGVEQRTVGVEVGGVICKIGKTFFSLHHN